MKKFALALCVLALTGCDNNKIFDDSYYKANPKKAQEILDKCSTGSESGENCNNAKKGLSKYNAQKFMDQMNGKTN